MSGRGRVALPPELEALVRAVLDAADLGVASDAEDVERELRAHFEDGLDRGVPGGELAARFGDPVAAGLRIARTRAAADGRLLGGRWNPRALWGEVPRAARRLARAPGFTAVVVLTLGLGVGVNAAVFTVLDATLLETLPYAEPERLVRIYEGSEEGTSFGFVRAPLLVEWMGWGEVFERVASLYTYAETGADLTGGDAPRRIRLTRVSAGYFETLGVAPILGRTFRPEESLGPGSAEGRSDVGVAPAAPLVVLSHGLWAEEYGGDAGVVGRTVQLDGVSFEVIGVMPRGFEDPFGAGSDVWVPQDLRPGGYNNAGNYYLSAVARLRPGLTVDAAEARLRTLARGLTRERPEVGDDVPLLTPLHDDVVGPTRRAMLLLLAGAAGLVLLTACVNVANLLFARGLERGRDLTLRRALGSGRGRLVAGILAENGLLATGGGLLGLALAHLAVRGLAALAPDAVPRVTELDTDPSVFLFCLGITAAALLLFGLAPALRLSRAAPAEVLRSGDRASTTSRRARRLLDGLVVVQVGAALALVAGATLLSRSFSQLLDVPLGIEPRGVLAFEVHLPARRYPNLEAREAFHSTLQERIAALPGVQAVGASSWLPAMGRYHTWGFYWEEENPGGADRDLWRSTDVRTVTGDYFSAMGIDVLRGVGPAAVDVRAEPIVWMSRTAALIFGERDPVGRQVFVANATRRVVGVVEDVPHSPRGEVARTVYVPHAQSDSRNWALVQVVKTRGDLTALRSAIADELATMDPLLVLYRPRSLEDALARVRAPDRFATLLMGAFAALALVLSQVGTFGVLAQSVSRRTRELGIRMALGADAARVRGMVLRYAAALTVPGIALGLGAAWMGRRWIESLLFGVEASDPLSYLAAVAVFMLVALVAAWVPAARATHVDAVEALSVE